MKAAWHRLGLIGILGITTCDPLYIIGMRQSLAPPPTMECLEATLRRSSRVTAVQRRDRAIEDAFDVAVRDTALRYGRDRARVRLTDRQDSTPSLVMEFHWTGIATSMPLEVQQRMLAIATELLEELRAACAPAVTTKVECFSKGHGGAGACASG